MAQQDDYDDYADYDDQSVVLIAIAAATCVFARITARATARFATLRAWFRRSAKQSISPTIAPHGKPFRGRAEATRMADKPHDTPPTSYAALPLCAVTGRIAGDRLGACGDCDPCGHPDKVPAAVKALMAERDQFADSYEEAAGTREADAALLRKAMEAFGPVIELARRLNSPWPSDWEENGRNKRSLEMKNVVRWIEDQILTFFQKRCKHPSEMVAVDVLEGSVLGLHFGYCRRCGSIKPDWGMAGQHLWRRPDPNLWRG